MTWKTREMNEKVTLASYNTLSFQIDGGIGHLEFNQPPSNEMTVEFFSEMKYVIEQIRSARNLKALVISGKGRHFSSGARLPELLKLATDKTNGNPTSPSRNIENFLEENNRSFLFIEELNIPVVSAIRGVCLGSALEIALLTHFRFCGDDAVFGLPETTFNLIPGIGGISRICSLSGKATALEFVLRGNTFSAAEARKMHLVDLILPKKEVVSKAKEFAASLVSGYKRDKAQLYLKRFSSHLQLNPPLN